MKIIAILLCGLWLVACSSSNHASIDAEKNTTSVPVVPAEVEIEDLHFENGLGEIQSQSYVLIVKPTLVDTSVSQHLPISAEQLSYVTTNNLTAALTDTHRFTLIEEEQERSADVDFYLISTLNQLTADETVRILKATHQGVEEKSVSISIHYQMVSAKDNKIVLNKIVHYQLKSTAYYESIQDVIANAITGVAKSVQQQMTNELYPIRILSNQNGVIMLDQPIAIGAQCDVYHLGQKRYDRYSNTLLGYDETLTGRLEITQSSSVISYATIVNGKANQGDVCKLIPVASQSASELIRRTSQGGVILPFD